MHAMTSFLGGRRLAVRSCLLLPLFLFGFFFCGSVTYAAVFAASPIYDASQNRFFIAARDVATDAAVGQFYGPDGTPGGEPFSISSPNGIIGAPSAASNSVDGSFLVVWDEYRNNNGGDIYGRVVNSDGSLGTETPLIAGGTSVRSNVDVAFDPVSQHYLVIWHENSQVGSYAWGLLVDAGGTVLGDPFIILEDNIEQAAPAVAADTVNGQFLVAFSEPSYNRIYGRLVAGDGSFPGNGFLVASGETMVNPAVAFNGSDQFLVAWTGGSVNGCTIQTGSAGSGNPQVGTITQLIETPFDENGIDICSDGTNWITVWQGADSSNGTTTIEQATFTNSLTPVCGPNTLTTQTGPDQASQHPKVAYNSTDDIFFAVWDTGTISWWGSFAPTGIGTATSKTCPPEPHTVAENDNSGGISGEPVASATGELFFAETDLTVNGPIPLVFRRYYASLLTKDGHVASTLGTNWMHNFDLRLDRDGNSVTVVYFGGKTIPFEASGSDWQLNENEPIVYQLIESGDNMVFMDPQRKLLVTFDGTTGRPTRLADRNNNGLTLSYNTDGYLETVSDGLGRTLTLTYTNGRLTRVSDYTGRSVDYTYKGNELATVSDVRGQTTTYVYTSAGGLTGLLTAVIRPEGNIPFTQTWDSFGRVATQTDSDNNTTTFAYDDPSPGVTTMMDPLSRTVRHTHEEYRELSAVEDAAGKTFSLGYDDSGRRNSITDRLGDTTSAIFHAETGYLASITNADHTRTTFTYSPQSQDGFTFYNLTAITYADSSRSSRTYDSRGNLLAETNRAGDTWTYTYNTRGQPLTITNPVGGTTTFSYNDNGSLAWVEDPFHHRTSFGYDALFRMTSITNPDATKRTFSYDAAGNLLTITDELGRTITYTYDANGNLESVTDRLNNRTDYTYDGNDRLTTITRPGNLVSTVTYNKVGLPAAISNPAKETTSFGYTAQGWLKSVSDPDNNTITMTYDLEGIPLSVTDALNHSWQLQSDKMGRITKITDPLTHQTSMSRDALGRVVAVTDPLGRTTSYTFDKRGLAATTAPGGISAAYSRDPLGRITNLTDPNGNSWDNTYDKMGRLVSHTDPLNKTTTYTYDSRNQISNITHPLGNLTISRDGLGRVTGLDYSDGTHLTYTYDAEGRLLTAPGLALSYDARGLISDSNGLSITRDNAGRLATVTVAPGKTLTYTYNSRGLISRVADWAGGFVDIAYNDANQITSLTRSNSTMTTYGYDGAGHLQAISEARGETSLSSIKLDRDADGRVLSAECDVPRLPAPSAERQDLAFDSAAQVSDFNYDTLGRLTGDKERQYSWDLASRLTSVTTNTATVTNSYDGLGLWTGRSDDTGSSEYVWNYALDLPAVTVLRENSSDARYFVHLPDGTLLYSIAAADNTRRFFHFDEAGNTLFLTDNAGTVTDTYAVTPYGRVQAHSGASQTPFTFAGAFGVMTDQTTGLQYMRARWYDPDTGRFLSRDPVALLSPAEINPYQYAVGDPLRFGDPAGLAAGDPSIEDQAWKAEIELVKSVYNLNPQDLRNLNKLRKFILGIHHSEDVVELLGAICFAHKEMVELLRVRDQKMNKFIRLIEFEHYDINECREISKNIDNINKILAEKFGYERAIVALLVDRQHKLEDLEEFEKEENEREDRRFKSLKNTPAVQESERETLKEKPILGSDPEDWGSGQCIL